MGFIFHAYATWQVLPSGMALVLPWALGLNSTRHKAARGLGAVAWNIKSDCGYIFVHCHNSYLRFHALFQRWDYHFVKLWILIENREYLVWGGEKCIPWILLDPAHLYLVLKVNFTCTITPQYYFLMIHWRAFFWCIVDNCIIFVYSCGLYFGWAYSYEDNRWHNISWNHSRGFLITYLNIAVVNIFEVIYLVTLVQLSLCRCDLI